MAAHRPRHGDQRPPIAGLGVSDVYPIARSHILDAWLHDANILLIGAQAVMNRVGSRVRFAARADLAVDVRDVPRDSAQA